MREQIFVLENYKSFNAKNIFECGQCFRWNLEDDGSYTGVFGENVLNVLEKNKKMIFRGACKESIIKTVIDYFDLDTNYDKIKDELSKIDENMKKSIEHGDGIRILNQDLWEMIISFIISANNNIPRIKGIIEKISKEYGRVIEFNNKKYYTFPTPEELSVASVEDLRKLGLGFRDKRVYETTQLVLNGKVDLEKMKEIKDTSEVRKKLLELPGVGPKVADCVMLFALKKFDAFPIDVWVRRVMNDLYIKNEDETKVTKKQIEQIAKDKYGNLAGIAQQYLFYWKREENKKAI